MKSIKKNWPFIVFIILIFVFFWRVFLQGEVPIPADLIVGGYYPWLDYKWGTVSGVAVKNPIQSDVVSVIYPIKLLAVELIKRGEIPLWNWSMFAGYPLLANFQIGLFFPTIIFYFLVSAPLAWSFQLMFQPWIALVGMYLFLRHLSLRKISSLFGAITYGFGGFMMIWLEWNVLGVVSAFLPFLLWVIDFLVEEKGKKWGILLSIIITLEIFGGYPQLVVYSLLVAFFWLLFKTRSIKNFVMVGFWIGMGVAMAAVILLPGFELFALSQRRFEILGSETPYLPWQYLIGLLAPDYFGNHATGNFWGYGNYTYMSLYAGLTSLVLAMVGLVNYLKDKKVLFFFLLFLITLLVMMPTPLGTLLYNLGLWGGKAASATRAAFILNFSLAVLGAFGIESLKKQNSKNILVAGLIFVIVLVITLLTYLGRQNSQYQGLVNQTQNATVALHNLILPFALSLIVASLLFILKYFPQRYKAIQIGFVAILIFELFRFGWKFNSFSPQSYLYPQTPISQFLSQHQDRRITGGEVMPSNMWLPFNIQSAAGYDAVYPLTWAKYIGVLNSNNPSAVATRFGTINKYDSKLFDLTSTDYILVIKKDHKEVSTSGQIDSVFKRPNLKPVFEDKSVVVLENTAALPRAFLVGQVKPADTKNIFKELLDPGLDINKTALVNDNLEIDNSDQQFPIPTYTQLANNHIQVSLSGPKGAFLVVTNSYYPGWKAKLDGKNIKIDLTDGAFWGVKVPPGQHTIDFVYYPMSLIIGTMISAGSLLVLLLLLILPIKLKK